MLHLDIKKTMKCITYLFRKLCELNSSEMEHTRCDTRYANHTDEVLICILVLWEKTLISGIYEYIDLLWNNRK